MKLYLPASRAASSLSRTHPAFRRSAYAPVTLWREPEALLSQAFRQSSPRYELTNTKDKFEVAVDVPGVKASDIDISLERNGQVPILTLSGQRERKQEGYQYSTKFSQSFSLDDAVDVEKITANLNNGVLVVSGPKDLSKLEEKIIKIPITEHAAQADQPAIENGADDAMEQGETANLENAKKEEIVVETVDAEMKDEEELEESAPEKAA